MYRIDPTPDATAVTGVMVGSSATMPRIRFLLLATLSSLALVIFSVRLARAQDAPTASVLATATSDGVRAGFSGAVDRMVRARLDSLGVVRVQGSVALDIAEVQLALGCVGETPECLGQAAQQIGVQVLILPNLDRAGDELVLGVARFDAASGSLRRTIRRGAGEDAETQILDAIESLLRELFELPALPEPDTSVVEEDTHDDAHETTPVTPASGPDLVLPGVTIGVGAAALIAGIATGVAFLGEQDAYALAAQTADDVAERASHRRTADDLALATNVLFIGGGVIAAAGVAWLVVELVTAGDASSASREAMVTPLIGPQTLGLSVSGRLPELR